MTRKSRKQERKRIRALEKLAKATPRKVDMTRVKSVEEMNDFCPYIYEKCGDPQQVFNFDCFGKYKLCKYYQELNQ